MKKELQAISREIAEIKKQIPTKPEIPDFNFEPYEDDDDYPEFGIIGNVLKWTGIIIGWIIISIFLAVFMRRG